MSCQGKYKDLEDNILYFYFITGAVHTPSKFTLTDVSLAHGSDANAGCPSNCLRMVSSVRVCDCVGVTTDRTGITLIDGVIPMLDVSQRNWAAQLYTATVIRNNLKIDFQFQESFVLKQVDLSLFFCPDQNIPNQGALSITVFQSILFPTTFKGLLFANITLPVEGQNCADLTQISISTNATSPYSQYLMEFSMENILEGIYIGEVSFSDEIAAINSSM